MNKHLPYLFWYASGAVFLVIIALFFVYEPEIDGKNAVAIKGQLDSKLKKYNDMKRRARLNVPMPERSPLGTYEPTDKTQMEKLSTDYLVNSKWDPVLKGHLKQYETQQTSFKDYFLKRSRGLHVEILATDKNSDWYETYKEQSAKLLARLHGRQALALPKPAPATLTPQPGAPKPIEPTDFENNRETRLLIGVRTRGDDFPDKKEWPTWTTEFRIIELLAERALGVQAETATHPAISVRDLPIAASPAQGLAPVFTSIRFGDDGGTARTVNAKFGGGVDAYATPHTVTVVCEGALSALTAFAAACEDNSDPERPILVVRGFTLTRTERKTEDVDAKKETSPERKDVPFERVQLRLDLVVFDFTKLDSTKTGK